MNGIVWSRSPGCGTGGEVCRLRLRLDVHEVSDKAKGSRNLGPNLARKILEICCETVYVEILFHVHFGYSCFVPAFLHKGVFVDN